MDLEYVIRKKRKKKKSSLESLIYVKKRSVLSCEVLQKTVLNITKEKVYA